MNKVRRRYIESCEVSQLVRYELGGVEQKATVEGRHRDAPVLIFLHGGPGSPLPISVGTRGMFPDIVDRHVLVAWDQLGCGANRRRLGDDACIDCYVDMTLDLVRAVRRDFPDNEVNLLGVSWGSILAARAAAREPGLVDRVVTYGQVLKEIGFNDEVFEALGRSAMPDKLKARLSAVRESGVRDLKTGMLLAGWVRKYTEGYQAQGGGTMPVGAFVRGLLESPDYTLRDLVAAVSNDFSRSERLFAELFAIDLSEELANMEVPYLVVQGETDIVTSTRALRTFVAECGNPNLHYAEAPRSGHMPGTVGMDLLFERIADFLGAPTPSFRQPSSS